MFVVFIRFVIHYVDMFVNIYTWSISCGRLKIMDSYHDCDRLSLKLCINWTMNIIVSKEAFRQQVAFALVFSLCNWSELKRRTCHPYGRREKSTLYSLYHSSPCRQCLRMNGLGWISFFKGYLIVIEFFFLPGSLGDNTRWFPWNSFPVWHLPSLRHRTNQPVCTEK